MENPTHSHPGRLFFASCVALTVTAMSFAIRGDIMAALEAQFNLSHEDSGYIAGTAFWGFTLAMIFGGPLCDVIGMGRLLVVAFIGHLVGIIITVFATGYWSLFVGTLAIGLANGFVEAACNPLVATLYPNDKTHKLNQFHVWFPGGIVIGGLVAFAISKAPVWFPGSFPDGIGTGGGWQIKMCTMLIPTLLYGALFIGKGFPKTERVQSGVSTSGMFGECTRPLFILLVCCMLLSAATELGTNQWIPGILKETIAQNTPAAATAPTTTAPTEDPATGILVLVWISGLMALGRQFAGPIVHRLSPTGMLLFSAIFSTIGLVWLSYAHTVPSAFGAATIFSIGICYFWPTMIGITSERLPKSGALGMAIMGGAGMLSVSIVLPIMGKIYDNKDGAMALRYMSALPAILTVVFAVLIFTQRNSGGYKKESIGGKD